MTTKLRKEQIEIPDGWIPTTETVTYSAAQTVTVSSALAAMLQKGAKLKLTNDSTTKYFYVSAVSGTTVTLAGEVNLANSAITSVYFSYADCPFGFKRGEDWYKCSVYQSGTQSIANGVDSVKVNLDAETSDPNGNYDHTTNFQYTTPISGYYLVQAQVGITMPASGCDLMLSASGFAGSSRLSRIYGTFGGSSVYVGGSRIAYIAKGTSIYPQIYQSSGAARTTESGTSIMSIQFTGV